MKLRIIILSLATLLLAAPLQAKDRTITKSPKQISVLYLGGTSDWNNDEMGTEKKFQNAKDYETSVQARTKAFGDLLRKHFGRVTVMAAKDYKPAMSNQYDVTIFDGCPPRLTERKYIRDKEGKSQVLSPRLICPLTIMQHPSPLQRWVNTSVSHWALRTTGIVSVWMPTHTA